MASQTVGVIGCGEMGLPMALAIAKVGYGVVGYDVRPHSEFTESGLAMAQDPTDFAAQADVIISVVRDWPQTLSALFEGEGVAAKSERLQTLVISSTLAPDTIAKIRARLDPSIALVDAPMSGAPIAAQERSLTFMVGGDEAHITALEPIFKAMGPNLHHMGPLGCGMKAKVLNNFLAASSVVAVRKMLTWADELGMDRTTQLALMAQSSGATWFGNRFAEINWAKQGYAPDNTMGIIEKDVQCLLSALDEGNSKDLFVQSVLNGIKTMPVDS